MLRLVKRIEGVAPGARLDWLHECHGPFPDFVGVFDWDGLKFTAAVWDHGTCFFVAVVDESSTYHGGVLMSYFWQNDEGHVSCVPGDSDRIYQTVLGKQPLLDLAAESIFIYYDTGC